MFDHTVEATLRAHRICKNKGYEIEFESPKPTALLYLVKGDRLEYDSQGNVTNEIRVFHNIFHALGWLEAHAEKDMLSVDCAGCQAVIDTAYEGSTHIPTHLIQLCGKNVTTKDGAPN